MPDGIVEHNEPHATGSWLEEFILGGQDGLVNVLGVLLGVAVATNDSRIVIIAGLAAVFAESISMGAVGYTSRKARRDYYEKERLRELKEMEEIPEQEREEVREIYQKFGYTGKDLDDIVRLVTSNKKAWLNIMMNEELHLGSEEFRDPKIEALVIFGATLIGSFIPLLPFLFFPVKEAIIIALILAVVVLFLAGAVKAKLTVGNWIKSGLEMAVIGFAAAMVGYAIGIWLGVPMVV
ncbi:MAG: VIT1/CCC1 transporter family protein [Candidatus Diapherotrites archaeon]|nr:VIT1/CCC1 transporter family protein [Candidatus Diapherotrites archaeon]